MKKRHTSPFSKVSVGAKDSGQYLNDIYIMWAYAHMPSEENGPLSSTVVKGCRMILRKEIKASLYPAVLVAINIVEEYFTSCIIVV